MKNCKWCAGPMPERQRLSGNPPKYCSAKCRRKASDSFKPKNDLVEKTCPSCQRPFTTFLTKQKYCSALCRRDKALDSTSWPRTWNRTNEMFESTCQDCNAFVSKATRFGKIIRCDLCRGKATSAKNRLKNTKRRQMYMGHRITVEALAIRDGLNCYLCNEDIDLAIPRNSEWGATIEHILPRSRGGMDTWDNVKLAHWICNNTKSDKLIEGLNA